MGKYFNLEKLASANDARRLYKLFKKSPTKALESISEDSNKYTQILSRISGELANSLQKNKSNKNMINQLLGNSKYFKSLGKENPALLELIPKKVDIENIMKHKDALANPDETLSAIRMQEQLQKRNEKAYFLRNRLLN